MNSDYERAVELVATTRKAGAAFLRQKLLLSESKIQRLLKAMEKNGVVSPMDSGGARQILVPVPEVEEPEVDSAEQDERA